MGSAQSIDPASRPDRVVFGYAVTIEREDGRTQTFKIVGEGGRGPHPYGNKPYSDAMKALEKRGAADLFTDGSIREGIKVRF